MHSKSSDIFSFEYTYMSSKDFLNPKDLYGYAYAYAYESFKSIIESSIIKNIKIKVLTKVNVEKVCGTTIIIPDDIDVVGAHAFNELSNRIIIIPENVSFIDSYAFYNITNCTIKINATNLCVKESAFFDCKNLIIHFHCLGGNVIIDSDSFTDINSMLLKFYHEDKKNIYYTSIKVNKYAFSGKNLMLDFTDIVYKYSILDLDIESGPFMNAEQISMIFSPKSSYMFKDGILYRKHGDNNKLDVIYCDKQYVEFSSNVDKIEEHSLSRNVEVVILNHSVTFAKTPWSEDCDPDQQNRECVVITNHVNKTMSDLYCTVYDLESKEPHLLSDTNGCWDFTFNWIWENYVTEDDYVFYNKTKTRIISHMDLSKVYSDGVDDLDDEDDLEDINDDEKETYIVPDSVQVICNRAFVHWETLEQIILSRVSCIGKNAFAKCYSLKHIDIPEGVKSIEEYTFYKCISLISIKLPNSLEYIRDYAFEGCKSLTGIEIPARVKEVNMSAFIGCYGLKKITFKGNPDITRFENEVYKVFENVSQLCCPTFFFELHKNCFENLAQLKTFDLSTNLNTGKYYMFLDTKTTGLPDRKYIGPDSEFWPRAVQMAWIVADETGKIIVENSRIIKPQGFSIPLESQRIHKISTSYAKENGESLTTVLEDFLTDLNYCTFIVGHNVDFDIKTVQSELIKSGFRFNIQSSKPILDTMKLSKNYYNFFTDINGKIKYPTISELCFKVTGHCYTGQNALSNIENIIDCFFKLKAIGVI